MLSAADSWCPPVFPTAEQFLCSDLPVLDLERVAGAAESQLWFAVMLLSSTLRLA